MAKQKNNSWVQQPSWWIVLIAGGLFLTFSVAIVRELMNGYQVRRQVQRLQKQVATAEQRQLQLQDLIDYLGSPTFQEQEARLKLGLKKTGEQVIVVPETNTPVAGTNVNTSAIPGEPMGKILTPPTRWWEYFFGPRATRSSSNA